MKWPSEREQGPAGAESSLRTTDLGPEIFTSAILASPCATTEHASCPLIESLNH